MKLNRLPYKIKRGLDCYVRLYLRGQMPVLVYSTGRVGSMAMHHSLEQQGLFAIQAHTFAPDTLKTEAQPGTTTWAYQHVIRPGRAAQIITLYRDPLAVMVSDFFPKLHWITGDDEAYQHHTVDELCHLFNTAYFEQGRHLDKLNWFEDEMHTSLDIDVYAYPSPRDDGYVQFEQPPYTVLALQTELDDTRKARLVGDFVGRADFSLMRYNVGETKVYGEVYKAFKARLVVDQAHIDTVYGSRYVQHFYSDAAIQHMIAHWRKTTQ